MFTSSRVSWAILWIFSFIPSKITFAVSSSLSVISFDCRCILFRLNSCPLLPSPF